MLDLESYRSLIGLDEERLVPEDPTWAQTVDELCVELSIAGEPSLDNLHAFLATVEPHWLGDEIIARIESVVAGRRAQDGIVEATSLPPVAETQATAYPSAEMVSLWVGDITRLRADVIVNAANQEMLGCRIPNHPCIDNAIHSAAGPRLRDDCAAIIDAQGTLEPVGTAKLTRGHALPARYVAHTVGPRLVPGSTPTPVQRAQLASCYTSCLDLAARVETTKSLAFCGISTGVFAYPVEQAAQVALDSISQWLVANPGRLHRIVIDCFTENDAAVYERLLASW